MPPSNNPAGHFFSPHTTAPSSSSFSWLTLNVITDSTVSSAVAAGSGGDCGAADGPLLSSSLINASPLSSGSSAKKGSPPLESYPSLFNSEFWLWNQFFRVGTALGKMDPPSAPSKTVPLAVPSPSGGKLVIDRPIGRRWLLFVWSALPLSPSILPSPKASISGSNAKHSSTRLSMLEFCKLAKFDNANAGRTPACVLALRGGRGGVPEGIGGVVKVRRLIVKLGSQP